MKRIFATDLDGTLLDRDGRIHPRDARAIADARSAGVIVTIATGRLTSGTLPIADALELDAPLVCADGAAIVTRTDRRLQRRHPMGHAHVDLLLETLTAARAARFVFTHEAIHSCELGTEHHGYVRGWSPDITTHEDVQSAVAWRADPDAALMVVGIGDREAIEDLAAFVERSSDLEALVFGLSHGAHHVIRVIRRGVSKGAALTTLAAEHGVLMRDVAVAGDWHNDASMFAVAGRSFAMPHAPSELRAMATDVLSKGAPDRGAIADALEIWLGE